MRIVVIGGSGHVGTFLVPRLVRAGHEVVAISRGQRAPYQDDEAWRDVRQVQADREAEDAAGTFPARVADLEPDAVVDMVCFTADSARALVEGLRGHTGHLVSCGSIWRYGPSEKLPVDEDDATPPVGEYGTQKDLIARLLQQETASGGLVTTTLHPGHISGPGWNPIGPVGNLDPRVWRTLSAGEELLVPGLGTELMHHVHADDVAQAFHLALENRNAAAGGSFNVVARSALTVRGFARIAAGWFGQEARLRSVGWDEFRSSVGDQHADTSWDHLWRSQYVSIERTRAVLGYRPAHEPEDAVHQAIAWLVEHGQLEVARPLVG